jgi:hypothetical protein
MARGIGFGILLSLVALAGCAEDEDAEAKDEPGSGEIANDPTCASGKRWTGGNEESALMHPGRECIACHQKQGEGPLFRVAGTVYEADGEEAGCFGFSGAQVVISAGDGQTVTLDTNSAGNFMHEGVLALPLQVKVVHAGKTRPMLSPVSDGDCNSCHAATGLEGAPGRILLP